MTHTAEMHQYALLSNQIRVQEAAHTNRLTPKCKIPCSDRSAVRSGDLALCLDGPQSGWRWKWKATMDGWRMIGPERSRVGSGRGMIHILWYDIHHKVVQRSSSFSALGKNLSSPTIYSLCQSLDRGQTMAKWRWRSQWMIWLNDRRYGQGG